jgi:hypothetical protein
MRSIFHRPFLGGAILGFALSAQALPNPKDPVVTLYERPPLSTLTAPIGKPASPPIQDTNGYWHVEFTHLASFSYGIPRVNPENGEFALPRKNLALLRPDTSGIIDPPTEPGTGGTIPPEVLALDKKRVRLSGFMLPIKTADGLATQFLILRNQMMCCYGLPPAPNEWVVVRMKGKGVPSRMDTPLCFYGTLHVGEIFENKVFEGLYELEVEKVSEN